MVSALFHVGKQVAHSKRLLGLYPVIGPDDEVRWWLKLGDV